MLLSKNRVIRRRAVVGLLVLAALALLSLSYRQGSAGVVGDIQRSTTSVTAPLTTAAHRVTQPFVDGWHWTTGLINARNENARLQRYQDEYTVLAARYQTLAQEAQKLQQLLNFKGSPIGKTYGSVAASVTVQSPDAYNGSVVIDAGTGDGLAPGDPVVAPYAGGGGLIGVTTSCVSSSCAVRLITDQQLGDSVTAKVLGSEAHGPLTPSSGDPGLLDLEMVSIATPVQTGATVVTWHLVGNRLQALLPAGIPIGRVSSVSQSDTSGGFKNIQVTPFVDFQNLSSVLVLKVAHAH